MDRILQTLVIRPFADADYAPMVELWNLLNPSWPPKSFWFVSKRNLAAGRPYPRQPQQKAGGW